VGNKEDLPGSKEHREILKDLYKERFPLISISAKELKGIEELKRKIYEKIDIIRVYTKAPGKAFDKGEPIILRKGDKVLDAALSIHKDFAHRLKYTLIPLFSPYLAKVPSKSSASYSSSSKIGILNPSRTFLTREI